MIASSSLKLKIHLSNKLFYRYIPSYLSQSLDTLAPDVIEEIDKINTTLASRLSADQVFAESRSQDGAVCVSLGVDTRPVTPSIVGEYIQKLCTAAKQIELSSNVII